VSYIAPYLVVFIAGPVLLNLLVKQDRSIIFFTGLAVAAAALTITALAIDRAIDRANLPTNSLTLVMLIALWLAWVLTIAICVRAIRAQFPARQMRRWSAVIGTIATTIPWFGLSAATYLGQ